MLYPDLELKYAVLAFDNIEVTEFKDLEDDLYQVSLVRTFSENNSLNDVEKSLLTLTYKATEPKDSLAFPYIIINSTGLINPGLLPYYVSACGAIKNKKYTDLEYKEYEPLLECTKKVEKIKEKWALRTLTSQFESYNIETMRFIRNLNKQVFF